MKMFNKKTDSQFIQKQLESINKNLSVIAVNTSTAEESKYKTCCELFIKTFEHERQKATKIEDKAYKALTFLLAVSSLYLALIIWFINGGYNKIILFPTNGPIIAIVILLLIVGAFMLLTSIKKSTSAMWTKLEYSPPGSFEHFHHFDKSDQKALDVYKYYSQMYSEICDKRRESNFERGDKLGKAFDFIKKTIYYCLFVCMTILLFTSPILQSLNG